MYSRLMTMTNSATLVNVRWAVLFAALLGVSMLYGIGLAQADLLHAAAHDGRHAFGFPCH